MTNTVQSSTAKFFAVIGLANIFYLYLFQQPLNSHSALKGHNILSLGCPYLSSLAIAHNLC